MYRPRSFSTLARSVAPLFATAALASCSGGGGGNAAGLSVVPLPAASGAPLGTRSAVDRSVIEHVIVVILENRSFDNLMYFYNAGKTTNLADTATTGLDHTGKTITLQPRSFTETSDAGHSHQDFITTFDGGKNDGWDLNSQNATKPDYQYGYLPQSEIQPYLDISHEFAIGDRFFHGVQAPTFPSHIEIGAGTTHGVVDNPSASIPWGCDAAAGTTTGLITPTGGVDEKGPFPCFDFLSIYDLLDRKGVSWKYYSEPEGQSISGNLVIPAAFRSIRYGLDWNTKIAPTDTQIDADITAGTLPSVSYVIPDSSSTDHAGTPSQGPMYVENLTNILGNSSLYKNTLMIVTWDDWGGWFDHVAPKILDATSLSYRKPIIFISPWVKHDYVTHVETEDASINKYLEQQFGLDSLGAHDVRANSFDDVFDFTQTPPAFRSITSIEVASPTSANPNFAVRPAMILGRHAGNPYFLKALDY